MANKKGVPANLKNFAKGDDARRNLDGRPKGSVSLKTILDRMLETVVETEDMDGLPVKMTAKEAIALKQLANAFKASDPNVQLKAAKQIFEHTDPITKEVNANVTVSGQSELSPDQAEQILKIARGG